jgi:hypothetical protein
MALSIRMSIAAGSVRCRTEIETGANSRPGRENDAAMAVQTHFSRRLVTVGDTISGRGGIGIGPFEIGFGNTDSHT